MKNDEAIQQAYECIVALSIRNQRISRSESVAVLSAALNAATRNLSSTFRQFPPQNSDSVKPSEGAIEVLLRGESLEAYYAALRAERKKGAQ